VTLSTKVYIHDRVDAHRLFEVCNRLISAPADVRFTDQAETWSSDGRWSIGNEPMQGLCAWLIITYRPDGPLHPEPEGHDDGCGEDCTWQHTPACWAIVDFDTGYSYRDEHGGCGDLHARLVHQLGRLMYAGDVSWSWRNEFTGKLHQGYDGLDALGSGGRKAEGWMRETVLPAIEAGEPA
jgi:hypothetical protein